jgi:DNA (cytosine-5)-methyltransferase 1
MRKLMTVVDLFAGIGGFTLGFLRVNRPSAKVGFDVRLLVDVDPTAAYTFKKNFPKIPYWPRDLSKLSGGDLLSLLKLKPGELDFLIGGPPCQGFSPNGKRWLEDNRNKLIAHFVSIANEIRPKCIIVENVPTALSAWQRLFNEEIQEAFCDYSAKTSVLNASAFGVPQIRKRAFIVALRNDLGLSHFDFPSGKYDAIEIGHDSHSKVKAHLKFVSVGDAMADLPPLKAGQAIDGIPYAIEPCTDYQIARRTGSIAIFNHIARAHSKGFLKKISVIKPGKGNAQLSDDERFSDNYFSQAYARLHPKGIGFTVTAHFRNPGSGRFTHFRDNRSITVREAARLQSFDDKIIFHGYETDQERHVGNAVPPLVSEALAKHFGAMVSQL